MKYTAKALMSVLALSLLLVASPVMAAEVDVMGENVDTGADSNNQNDYELDNDVEVDVENDSDVDNEADVDADTGDNDVEENTNAGDLTTGVVDASAEWETVTNAGSAMMGAGEDGVMIDGEFTNDTTGADSNNENELDFDNDVEYELDNMADILNSLDFDADTGDNDVEQNTNVGAIETGDASLHSVISNWANNDSGLVGAAAQGPVVDVTATNETTGAESNNQNEFDIDSEYSFEVENDADINNNVNVDIDTGGNNVEQNTNSGDLKTGSAEVTVEIENSANNGGGHSSGANAGSLDVTGNFKNDTTGFDSNNENELEVDNEVDVEIENDADVDNDVDVDVDTGDNDVEQNTNGGSVETGDVEINLNISNDVNSN